MQSISKFIKNNINLCAVIAVALLLEMAIVVMFRTSLDMRSLRLLLLVAVGIGSLILCVVVYRNSRYLEKLRQADAEKQRISSDLRATAEIQRQMLPPGHLLLDDVEVFGSQKPALEVGGDLFGYFIRDNKLFFCIGDVCGKGTAAAMLMASVQTMLGAVSLHESNPARIAQIINEAASEGNEACLFVTLFIGVLDLSTGNFQYCNAGHTPPYILGSQLSELPCDPNLPIGPFANAEFSLQSTTLAPGSTIFLYTDGVTEAQDSAGQEFGPERTKRVLNACIEQQLKPEAIANAVTDEVHRFTKDAPQSDDLTMLVVHYTPGSTAG